MSSEHIQDTATTTAPAPATPARTIAVVDGNSLMHRAFHGTPPTFRSRSGQPTNAIFGFFNMLIKLVESFNPDGVIVAFDKGRPQVRIDMLPQYKAQRPSMDPDLRSQFPLVKGLLTALDIPVCELEGWEGDDILGTLAQRGEAAGYHMLLVTGDRDMYQLSTPSISIIATKKGVSDVQIMTPESVEDLYHGITPELVPDFYGLKGDSSDNIPGVPGIGPKRAAELICTYGSLDEVIAHADEVKGKMGENLRAHIDDALLSRKVATIRCDAPIELDLKDSHFPTYTAQDVMEAFAPLDMHTIPKRLIALADLDFDAAVGAGAGGSAPAETALDWTVTAGDDARTAVNQAIARGEELGVQLQTQVQNLKKPEETRDAALWVAGKSFLAVLTGADQQEVLLRLLKYAHIISFDTKALLRFLCPQDSSLPAALDLDSVEVSRLFDAGIAAYLLNSDLQDFSAPSVWDQLERTGSLPEPNTQLPEAAIAARVAVELATELRGKLKDINADQVFYKIEMPLVPVLCAMERNGLAANAERFGEQSEQLGHEIDAMVETIMDEAGEPFNINSSQQLSHILFDVMKMPTVGLKRTKKGFISTNASVLSDLANQYPFVQTVLDYRERAKIKSTYLDALPLLIAGDGRIHTSLNQTVAATGRLSSSDPNLQNIPTRSELGHRVRSAFVAPEGTVFVAVDYSQIELRLLAHLSQDEHLIAAFRSGEDFHAQTAARTFGVPLDEVTPALRSRAKAVNFGIVYGQQAFGLSQSLKIERSEAQEMINRYFEAFPGVKTYLDGLIKIAHKTGYAETLFGRRRYIKEFALNNRTLVAYGERTAMNHPVQGTAADIIKMAMIEVERALKELDLESKMVLQIHDELDFEVPVAELERLSEVVKSTMEGVVTLDVPLIAEVSSGATWAEAK